MSLKINQKFNHRTALIVWVRNFADQKKLYQYGNVVYASKKMRYVYLYVETAQIPEIVTRLKKANFVKKVTLSKIPELDFTAENAQASIAELKTEALRINEKDGTI